MAAAAWANDVCKWSKQSNNRNMKRIILAFALIVSAMAVSAQSIEPRYSAHAEDYVYRTGNTYVCNGQVMNKYAYRDFLSTRYIPAYEQFQNGLRVSNVGWGLLGGGLALDIIGSGMILGAVVQGANNTGSDLSEGIGNAVSATMLIIFGKACCSLGGTLKIAAIPTLCVGYARMHKSVDVYNVRRVHQSNVSLGVSTSGNGIGLALNF